MAKLHRIEIASAPDRDEVVAEVWCDGAPAFTLGHAITGYDVEFHARPDGRAWRFGLGEVLGPLADAEAHLAGHRG